MLKKKKKSSFCLNQCNDLDLFCFAKQKKHKEEISSLTEKMK